MGRVNEVTVQDLAGEPVVFAATEDWMVHAIDAEGNDKWRQTFPQNKERKGNLLGITSVRTAYLDGKEADPRHCWHSVPDIYKLDMNGNILDHHMLYYYGIEDMEFADFDGDGKEEGFIGLEYSRYNYWNDHTLCECRNFQPRLESCRCVCACSGRTAAGRFAGHEEASASFCASEEAARLRKRGSAMPAVK